MTLPTSMAHLGMCCGCNVRIRTTCWHICCIDRQFSAAVTIILGIKVHMRWKRARAECLVMYQACHGSGQELSAVSCTKHAYEGVRQWPRGVGAQVEGEKNGRAYSLYSLHTPLSLCTIAMRESQKRATARLIVVRTESRDPSATTGQNMRPRCHTC